MCPEPDLRSLHMDFFQTWYNHGTYPGAYAHVLIFELRSNMAARRPYLFSKLPDFVCPRPVLESLRIYSFQTLYNYETCLGAYAHYLIFEFQDGRLPAILMFWTSPSSSGFSCHSSPWKLAGYRGVHALKSLYASAQFTCLHNKELYMYKNIIYEVLYCSS